ncbi:MAG: hypothetical protein ACYTBJ_00135 [Planctomycetota bacterium]|jgi:hypothetical protein
MTMQYTGRSWDTIMASCAAEYRFYRNSLRNFRPASVEDLLELLINNVNNPKQSICHNMPAMCIDHTSAHFNFPNNLDLILADEAEFTIEYFGHVQDRGTPNGSYLALLGEQGSANPYIGLLENNTVRVNFGAAQTSDPSCMYWKDSLIHFVLTREAGAAPLTTVYINGSALPGLTGAAAGAGGFVDQSGQIFNHVDDTPTDHPCWGHHFLLRFFSIELAKSEVLELYQDVQRLVPHHLLHIPIWTSE